MTAQEFARHEELQDQFEIREWGHEIRNAGYDIAKMAGAAHFEAEYRVQQIRGHLTHLRAMADSIESLLNEIEEVER